MMSTGGSWVRTHNTGRSADSACCRATRYRRAEYRIERVNVAPSSDSNAFEDTAQTIGGRIRTAISREAPAARNASLSCTRSVSIRPANLSAAARLAVHPPRHPGVQRFALHYVAGKAHKKAAIHCA